MNATTPSGARSAHRRSCFPALFALVATLVLSAFAPPLAAEELWSDSGFFVDLPEGMYYADGDGLTRFAFEDPSGRFTFQIALYEPGRFPTAAAFRDGALRMLKAAGEAELYVYQRREAFLGIIDFAAGGEPVSGFVFGVKGAVAGAGPASGEPPPKDVLLLAYSAAGDFESLAGFMLSCIDAFSIDAEARLSPGPVAQFERGSPSAVGSAVLSLGGKSFKFDYEVEDLACAASVVDREFGVLSAYAEAEGELAVAAWRRFYRMIARDSFRRVERLAFAISRELGPALDPRERAELLVRWTQGFTYERNLEGADFVNPLAAAVDGRGDCDSRALLVLLLLAHENIEGVLLVSSVHAHALAGLDVEGPGARFPWNGRDWLVAETTDEVDLGLIDREMADPADWLAVELPIWPVAYAE
ncbi:MAG TPA: hypothetical protein PKW82_01010 [Spirochaetales bacterium]|nr:hypothetical protein [Spirochaetales bacterium]